MRNILLCELQRMIHSTVMRLALVIACLLSTVSAAQQFYYYLHGADHISVFYRWIGQYNVTFGSKYLYMLIPLLAASGYSLTVSTDYSTGYCNQLMIRCSKRKWIIAKYIAVYVSGGLIFAAAILWNLILLTMFMQVTIPDPTSLTTGIDAFRPFSRIYFSNPFLFCVLWIMVDFLWGGIMAALGSIVGCWTSKKYLCAIIPFFIFVCEGIVGTYFMITNPTVIGNTVLSLAWTDMMYSGSPAAIPSNYLVCLLIIFTIITLLLYFRKAVRYDGVTSTEN